LNQDVRIDTNFFKALVAQDKTACDLNLGKMYRVLQILGEKEAALKT
jgi:hypothetical protein